MITKKLLKERLSEKKGMVSVIAMLYGSALFITMMWLSIDFTFFMQQNRSLKNMLDNATSSAVTSLLDESLGTGYIRFQTQTGKTPEDIAMKLIKSSLILDDNNNPKEGSPLRSKPIINIYTIDSSTSPTVGEEFTLPNGQKMKVENPSIVIYAEMPVKGLFLKNLAPTIKHVSGSQVTY